MRTLIAAILTAVIATNAFAQDKPNILVIWGDDIGNTNISSLIGSALYYFNAVSSKTVT